MRLMSQSQFSLGEIWRALDDTCARLGCAPIVDESQRHVFDEIIPCTMDRRRVVAVVLVKRQRGALKRHAIMANRTLKPAAHRRYFDAYCFS